MAEGVPSHVPAPNAEGYAFPPYEPQVIVAPTLAGVKLSMFAGMMEGMWASTIAAKLIKDNGMDKVRPFAAKVPVLNPMFTPYVAPSADELARHRAAFERQEFDPTNVHMPADHPVVLESAVLSKYFIPFRNRTLTPTQVLENTLKAIAESNASKTEPMRAFVSVCVEEARRAAAESTSRFERGEPLSVLDGVPIGVKVEMGVRGQPHSLGTSFLLDYLAPQDSLPAAKLRAAGAIMVGMTNMHEIGLGTTGFNSAYGSARNPHNLKHHTGGSSSGSGAAVAAGLVPIGLSADGGGSIRIPAALCGVVGLKATFGRIPCEEDIAFTVGHCGPIAATVADCAIAYKVLAGNGTEGAFYSQHPTVHFDGAFGPTNADLTGVRVGVFKAWNDDCDPVLKEATAEAMRTLHNRGATVVPIEIPYLPFAFASHTISILTEMIVSCCDRYGERAKFSAATRVSLALAKHLSNADYCAAQVNRRWFYEYMRHLFTKVDVILTPSTAMVAPEIPDGCGEVGSTGESNLKVTAALMRYMWLANLTGIPAISFPVGVVSPDGKQSTTSPLSAPTDDAASAATTAPVIEGALPVSMQLMSDSWNEAALLRLARVLQKPIQRPKNFFDVTATA